MNVSLTTVNGYVTVGLIFFAALAAEPSLPNWLKVVSLSGSAICAAARITVGHLQQDAVKQIKAPTNG